jgi:multicomponent Na+:H+ antiporter subunit E
MRFLTTWVLLAAFWILLSGHFDAVHLIYGVVSVTLVSALSSRHLMEKGPVRVGAGRLLRLFAYAPWLLWEICKANIDVLLRVIGVRSVDPRVVRLKPDLHTDFGIVAYANSITLTPGTVTIEVEDGHLIVHAVAPDAVQGLLGGEMEKRVRWVEGRQP